MIALSDPFYIQWEFSTLVGLFYWLDLETNVRKTVGVVCRLCQAAGTQLEALYERRMMGAGISYQETVHVSKVFRVRVGDRVGVAGSPPTDASQEGNRRETELGYYEPKRRATHL